MAKTAKHDVFDMSDDIARIKRTKSVEVSDVGDSGNDLSYTTGKGSQRRVAKDTDKMVNVRVSKELHRRFRMESIDRGESMNLLIVRAMVDYAERNALQIESTKRVQSMIKATRPQRFASCLKYGAAMTAFALVAMVVAKMILF